MAQESGGIVQRLAGIGLRIAAALSFLAPLLTRLVIGWAFHVTGHGKLENLDRTTQFFGSLGIPLPHVNAIFVSWLEFAGGLFIFVGLFTRIFAALLSFSMIVALLTSDGGEWLMKFPGDLTDVTSFTFLLFLLWLVFYGPGPISVDRLLSKWLRIGQQPGAASVG
ncbi:MAG TPA: DoxX family protein [Bryobacteraceae bacterium]|nr:DoxX family protein [Bryobacteraceae bacterium]